MLYVGIDPGKAGAVAAIRGNKVLATCHTSTLVDGKEYRPAAMKEALVKAVEGSLTSNICVTIEKSRAMPGQGVVSMFSFGYGFGLWVGIVTALGWTYQLVGSNTWKRRMLMDLGKDKGASIIAAERLFPTWVAGKKKDEAIAEALLLAEYGRRIRGEGA